LESGKICTTSKTADHSRQSPRKQPKDFFGEGRDRGKRYERDWRGRLIEISEEKFDAGGDVGAMICEKSQKGEDNSWVDRDEGKVKGRGACRHKRSEYA